ncbi:sensor histidine kinase [Amycolatopsis mediterranei]|uniref:sensor histidine kinase n=1 Tax=Amycolatopsis mediterranei TaxID=33910 RepID=UPI00333312D7
MPTRSRTDVWARSPMVLRRPRVFEAAALVAIGLGVIVDAVSSVTHALPHPLVRYAALVLVCLGVTASRRYPWPGLATTLAGPLLAALLGADPLPTWTFTIFATFVVTLRGVPALPAGLVTGVADYAAIAIHAAAGGWDDIGSIAVAFALAAAATGSAIRGHHRYWDELRKRTQDAVATREAEAERRVAEERVRIARDLHDHVIQRLFAVGLGIEGTRRRSDSPAVTSRLIQHIDQLQDVIEEIRSAIFALHAQPGAGRGLRARLQNAITDGCADSAIRTTVRLSGAFDRVPAGLAEHAEAVVREAVTNVLRHARAADLAVTVSLDDDLVVEVSDTGIGMPEAVARSGLRNLEQRAAEAGGSLRLDRPAGGGTCLVWTVPVP